MLERELIKAAKGTDMRDHYKGYRTPKSIIGFAVRYYHRFKLSLRDISELLLDRGIKVTYETIRNWNKTWGPLFAKSLRKRRGSTFTPSSRHVLQIS